MRLLCGVNKELYEGEVLPEVGRDGEPRGDPQVRRQVIEEVLRVCTMTPSKWDERWLEVLARDLLRAKEHPVLNGLPPTGEGGILGPGLLCLDEPEDQSQNKQSNATALTPWATPSTNARIPHVQRRGGHLHVRRLG